MSPSSARCGVSSRTSTRALRSRRAWHWSARSRTAESPRSGKCSVTSSTGRTRRPSAAPRRSHDSSTGVPEPRCSTSSISSRRRLGGRCCGSWNLGHERGEKIELMDKGQPRQFDIHAPMLAAGLGSFMAQAQLSRTYPLDMVQYTTETKPERDYRVNPDLEEFNAVYSFIDEFAKSVELNP